MKMRTPIKWGSIVGMALLIAGCGQPAQSPIVQESGPVDGGGKHSFRVDVWADNWFAFYVGDTLVLEDSVSIKTERSFNAESATFEADYPLQLNFVARDFIENDTGLEYIGSRRQQMGDGGFIAQVTDMATGEVIAATDSSWRCKVVHRAPLDVACVDLENPLPGEGPCTFEKSEEPEGWKTAAFDDTAWAPATEHSESTVRPKDGYNQISWATWARLIWSSDLEQDNTVLLRKTIAQPS